MFENPRRGRQARNFTTTVPKILDLKSSSEQIFSKTLSLGAPDKGAQVNRQNFSSTLSWQTLTVFVPKVHCDGKTTLICSSKVIGSPFTNKNPHIFKLQNKSTTAELVGPKRYCCQNGCLETTWRSFHERAIKAPFLDLFSHHFSVMHIQVM